ncbi:sugar transferase [Streptomyces purpureus]|uniref:sugar transferase n=1 Tax=Streptomyces purpureus TaxID=1951 RepID=UPI0037AFB567
MTTESTLPPSPGHLSSTAGPAHGLTSLAPARGASDRPVLPARRSVPPRSVASPLVAVDCTAVLLAAMLLAEPQRHVWFLAQLTISVLALNAYAGLHRPAAISSVLDELPALATRALVAWCAAAAVLAAYAPAQAIALPALGAAYGTHLAVVCLCRGMIHGRRRRAARAHPRSALVVGAHPAARRLATALAQHPEYGIRPVGIVGPRKSGAAPEDGLALLPVLSSPEEVHRAIIQNTVREAVFVGDDVPGQTGLVSLLQYYGCATWRIGDAAGDAGRRPAMNEHLWGYACRRITPVRPRRGRTAKRLLDIAGAGLMLAVAAPVLLVCAAAVRLSDGPGVLFRQERVGQHGRLFTLLKFRTLRPSDETESATRWSVANDSRMSPVGRFLRRSSLDELPQLWNVLRGDMSLVGPRPERPFFVAKFSRIHTGYAARHRMPVGLTGLAQVHGLRGDTSIEDRCRFDNHYIDTWSLWQDICILLRTAASLVRPAGS